MAERQPIDLVCAIVFVTVIVLICWAWLAMRPVIARVCHRRTAWKPKSPLDCPVCRNAQPRYLVLLPEIQPWRPRRSRRGAKKRYDSEGFACPNPDCIYFGCSVASIHALVSDGFRGQAERIHRWRCQACGRSVSERWRTPLYYLKTPSHRVSEVMTALAEGVDESAAQRIFHHDRRTITRWLSRCGSHAQRLHDLFFHHLHCAHLQLDELVTTLRGGLDRVWIWAVVDAQTKIVPVIHIGRRTVIDAHVFVHQLKLRLRSDHVPAFSSDGLRAYYSALTAHFGLWRDPEPSRRGHHKPVWIVDPRLLFGQLHKVRCGRRLKTLYTRIRCGSRRRWQRTLMALGFSGQVQTAFIERLNLTLRELTAPLSRRTWSLARTEASLTRHLHWVLAYYHFVRPHQSLCVTGRRDRLRTPAMAAGLIRHRWTVSEVIRYPVLQ
jgi:IS1 family transposase